MSLHDLFAKLKNVFETEVEPAMATVAAKFSYKGMIGGEAVLCSLFDFTLQEIAKHNIAAVPVDLLNELSGIFFKPGVLLDVVHGSLLAEVQSLIVKYFGPSKPLDPEPTQTASSSPSLS